MVQAGAACTAPFALKQPIISRRSETGVWLCGWFGIMSRVSSLPGLRFDPPGDLILIEEEPVLKMVTSGPDNSDPPEAASANTTGGGAAVTPHETLPTIEVEAPVSLPAVEHADGTVDAAEVTTEASTETGVPTSEAMGSDDGSDKDAVVPLDLLEALLLSTHHPLTAARLAELLKLPGTKSIRPAVMELNEQYTAGGRRFRVEQVAGGYQILTLPSSARCSKSFTRRKPTRKLTKAALETLSIIAYKQPILRADVEAIRGVACGETIRSLMEKHLVKIAGRAEEPGRPILYGTTRRFLELFGLNTLKDLPQPEGTEKPKP